MLSDDLDQWPRLSALLDELLDLDHAALESRLASLREEDPMIANAVQRLLDRLPSIQRDGFLLQLPTLPDESLVGQTIGTYRIEREIGHGGMGTVWMARRTDGRFEVQVAIKILLAGLASRGGMGRFAREGSILARLSHPHIARLIDAGLTPGSLPYLVLEYVDGLPIDVYSEQAGLDTRARVRLCLDVLDAVAHAHTRLILHRDIKPSNILVTAAGEVKLLDFGIAKLLDEQSGRGQATDLTREAGNAFTMLYAAPEQVQGGDVTTATDVYALGVLLHVLLCGLYPGGSPDTALDRLRELVEVEAQPMSQALLQARPGDLAATGRARQLRGDLDTIVGKALKKLAVDRYANAEQLADDLRRWLASEPILARRDAALYRLRKFVVRQRVAVAAGVTVLVALTVGIGVSLWQAVEAHSQRVQAEGLIEFMLGDLRAKLQPVGRLDALDAVGSRVIAYYAAQDAGQLDAESLGRRSRALHLIGEIAESRGNLTEAIRVFTQAERSTGALLTRTPHDGQRIFDHAQSVYWVGYIAWRQGRLAEAEGQFKHYKALAGQLIALGADKTAWQAEMAYAQQNLGTVLFDANRLPEARRELQAAQVRLQDLAAGNADLISELGNNMSWLARTDERLGHLGQAIAGLQARITLLQSAAAAPTDKQSLREVGSSRAEIARLELARGRPEGAQRNARAALEILAPLSLSDPANTLWRQELAGAHLRLADALRSTEPDLTAAREQVATAMTILRGLVAQSNVVARWRINLLGQALLLNAQTALPAQREAAYSELRAWFDDLDPGSAEATRRPTIARAGLLLGDHLAAGARSAEAQIYWARAAAQVSDDDPNPDPMAAAFAALVSARLGDMVRARRLALQLKSTEFQHPDPAGPLLLLAAS